MGEILLWLLVLFVPWNFGSVDAGSEWVVCLLVTGLGGCLIKRVVFERRRLEWNLAFVPLLALIVLAWLSTLPLPIEWVKALAPQNLALRHQLLSTPDATGTTTLAFYPLATRHMLRLMLGSAIVALATLNFCRTSAHVKRLLLAVTLSGGAVAIEALLQDATSPGLIYWSIPAPVKSTSGPFVNYNNFCQYMNLTIAAAAGLLMTLAWGKSPTRKGREEVPRDSHTPGHVGLLATLMVLAGLSILLSTSRGGVLAMLTAGVVMMLLLLAVRASGKVMRMMALAAMAMVFLLLTWGLENFMGRMATLSDLESASGMRWQVFQDVVAVSPRFGVWGIGLGNHEFVYPMFSHLATWRNAQFVENEYLQLLEETGGIGLALGILFLAAILWNIVAILRHRRTSVALAGVGLAYGMVAVAMASVTDFGQRLASVSTVTAVVIGLILAIRRLERAEHARITEVTPSREQPKWLAPIFSLAMLILCIWTLWGATHAAAANEHWKQAAALEKGLVHQNWQGNDEQYEFLTRQAGEAVAWEPDNVEYRCWWNIYRWHQSLRPSVWDAMTDQERGRLFTTLLDEFRQGERTCPTYGLNFAMAGQISYLGLHDPAGVDEILTAYRLAPTHPAVCFIAGRLFATQGQWTQAQEAFRRAMALHYARQEVLAVYLKEVNRPDLAAEVFEDDWESLTAIERALEKDPGQDDLAEQVGLKAQAALTAEAQKPQAPVQTLVAMADLLQRQGNLDEAIKYYRRAIDASYASVNAHLGLARALGQKGDLAPARAEADICLRLQPDMPAAKRLLSDLAVPAAPASMPDSSDAPTRNRPDAGDP